MTYAALNSTTREESLTSMAREEGVDVLVVGGGVTGAGIALDAASRGLSTAIIEAQDWASGTSSRSSKLAHGGLRYLLMLDFKLVHEALTERDLLLSTTAPHLVQPIPFLYPLRHRVWERAYVACGVGMYDALAHSPGRKRAMPIQKHLTKTKMLEVFPDFKRDAAIGAVRYFDSEVDDARLVIYLVRTAMEHGAFAATRTQMLSMTKDASGRVNGVDAVDLISGKQFHIKAKNVILATGVWTEETEALAGNGGGLKVLASKGIHIVVPRTTIKGKAGIITQTEKSVLFIIPWQRYWIIGTTDTPWEQDLVHPVATEADIDYVIDHANAVLERPITREDVIGVYAGLRPLLQPGTKEGTSSAKVSREHTVASPVPGVVAIAGGKLTTYRVMAKDAVDFALGDEVKARPCVTDSVPLVGAEGYDKMQAEAAALAAKYGWDKGRTTHLLHRYGSVLRDIVGIIEADPSMGEPLEHAPAYLRAEVSYGVTHEGALHLDDMLMHRVRLNFEERDRGLSALDEIADIMAPLLGWDAATKADEIDLYRSRAQAEAAAEKTQTDAQAEEVRLKAREITPMRPLSSAKA